MWNDFRIMVKFMEDLLKGEDEHHMNMLMCGYSDNL